MSSNRIPTARAAGATRVEKLCGRAGRIPVFAFDLHISPRHLVRSRRRCVSMPTHLAAAEGVHRLRCALSPLQRRTA